MNDDFKLMIDTLPALAWASQPDGRAVFFNRRWLDYTGLTSNQALDWGWKSAIHPDDLENLMRMWLEHLETGTAGEIEARMRRFDGEYHRFLLRVTPAKDSDGKVVQWYGTNTDIQDLKNAEAPVAAREKDLREIIDAIAQHIVVLDPEGRPLYANRQMFDYTGFDPDKTDWEQFRTAVFHPEDRELLREIRAEGLAAGLPFELEQRVRRHDGVYRWVLIQYKPFRDADDKILRWYCSGTDIDERKREVERLQQSEGELREIFDAIPQRIIVLDPNGKPLYANQQFSEYTGWDLQECDYEQFLATLFHPEDVERIRKVRAQSLAAGLPFELEQRALRRDGIYRWILLQYKPFRDADDKILRWYCTGTDIDERKKAEERLQKSERELREIINAIPQRIIVLDPAGKPLYANKQLFEFTGWDPDKNDWEHFLASLFHPEDIARLRDIRAESLAAGLPFELEQRAIRHDGVYRWTFIQYKPFRDPDGKILRWYCTGIDIDERKKAEDRIRNETITLREDIARDSMFEEIVGSCPALRTVLSHISKVAPTDSTVLILGATGTGKELTARAIHKKSNRASRAFVRVNCAAIPQSLIASELFGHEKGAFTGATQRRIGRFESADGGTIFLDEVGELPLDTQVALLRVLQEREIERVGSNQTIPIDVRVIAATNRDMNTAVAEGTIRQDLFFRLNVFPIRMPSLRERKDDIHLLAEYLINRFAKNSGKKIVRIQDKTLELFKQYEWPGNVRELQNVIERAVILCESDTFSIDESWLRIEPSALSPAAPLGSALTEHEREIIETALRESRGMISGPNGAAARLGIPRQTLEYKIRTLGINKFAFKTTNS